MKWLACLWLVLLAGFLAAFGWIAAQPNYVMPEMSDEEIIRQILLDRFDKDHYVFVRPDFSKEDLDGDTVNFIRKELDYSIPNLDGLCHELTMKNKNPSPLELPSSPKDGYIVDREGVFGGYFKKHGIDGWDVFYKEHPKSKGSIHFSRPTYDRRTGIVMISIGRSFGSEGGWWGYVFYRYENGKLIKIQNVTTTVA